ncbi:hypothetical protein POJ06DRAFT_240969 [Lipomyces tetrasporus]|uniref:N-acetyltransferase domain-containing protein n=1 Tax=Lipomyces tetrasporus TaxID=54092 RepID=A0AAD7VNW8_9ASCO|nr:uncharacterized protein POJ06DRAFT_240969 [Lipomyces tetrasporus]KAJ8096937.1 hypothetical protein POJ06DRAFT_240969 [Lipomyces tetrasporus]
MTSSEASEASFHIIPAENPEHLDGSTDGNIPLGCVAVRPLKQKPGAEQSSDQWRYCEMKRLYVSPQARGMGLGKALDAIQLYKRVGFVEIAPYYETPLEGTLFLALDLTSPKLVAQNE